MLFPVLLIYVVFSYVYPGEVFPALAPLRIPYWIGLIGLGLSVLWLTFKRSTPLTTLQFWLLAVFALVLALSRMINDHYLGAVVPTLTDFGPSLAMFVLSVAAIDSLRKLKVAAACIGVLCFVLVLQGVAAFQFGYRTDKFLLEPAAQSEYGAEAASTMTLESRPPSSMVDESTSSDSMDDEDSGGEVRIRGLGLLHDPNDLAVALVFGLPLLGFLWKPKKVFQNLLLVVIPACATIYGVFLTHSRGGTLALIATLCLATFRRFGRVSGVIVLCVLASGALAADFGGGRKLLGGDDSAEGRVEAWSEGLQMLKAQPLLGVGYRQFLDHHPLTAHNSFVLCFAETGLVGYFLWLGMIVVTFFQLRALANSPPRHDVDVELSRCARIIQLSMVGFFTAAFFLSRTYIPMLYLLVGLAVALLLIARDTGKPVWLPSLPQVGGLVLTSELASIALIYLAVKLNIV